MEEKNGHMAEFRFQNKDGKNGYVAGFGFWKGMEENIAYGIIRFRAGSREKIRINRNPDLRVRGKRNTNLAYAIF